MRQKRFIGLMIVILVIGLVPMPTVQGQENGDMHYGLFVPSSYDATTPLPLVVMLHPFASSGRAIEALTGFDAIAEEEGFIVLYPDSGAMGWNDGRSRIPGQEADLSTAEDAEHINGLVEQLLADYAINPDQVYLAGFAQGANMAMRLACETPAHFAKVMLVATTLFDYQLTQCRRFGVEAEPRDLLIVNGSEDPIYPIAGRLLSTTPLIRASTLDETVEFLQGFAKCEADDVTREGSATIYTNCSQGVTLTQVLLKGIGHNWPRVGDYELNQFGVDLSSLAWQWFSGQDPNWDLDISLDVNDGQPRNYTVYIPPSYSNDAPMPAVVALHGRPSSAYGMAYILDMNRLADQAGFIAVYPDGYLSGWNYSGGFSGYENNGMQDSQFLKTMLDDLALDLAIDRERIYLMGFSNGGFMTQRAACEASDTFAAFGVIGSTLFPGFVELCAETRPVPIVFFHGDADESVPAEGVTQGDHVVTAPIITTISYWVGHDHCSQDGVSTEEIPPSTTQTKVNHFSFSGCADDVQVQFYRITGGGHTIPGVDRLGPDLGLSTPDIVATEIMWDFFSQFTLSRSSE